MTSEPVMEENEPFIESDAESIHSATAPRMLRRAGPTTVPKTVHNVPLSDDDSESVMDGMKPFFLTIWLATSLSSILSAITSLNDIYNTINKDTTTNKVDLIYAVPTTYKDEYTTALDALENLRLYLDSVSINYNYWIT